jgi:hypothetical protein
MGGRDTAPAWGSGGGGTDMEDLLRRLRHDSEIRSAEVEEQRSLVSRMERIVDTLQEGDDEEEPFLGPQISTLTDEAQLERDAERHELHVELKDDRKVKNLCGEIDRLIKQVTTEEQEQVKFLGRMSDLVGVLERFALGPEKAEAGEQCEIIGENIESMPTLAMRMAERQRRLAQKEKANEIADSLSEAVHLRLQYERRLQVMFNRAVVRVEILGPVGSQLHAHVPAGLSIVDGFENLNDHDGDHAVNAIVEGPIRLVNELLERVKVEVPPGQKLTIALRVVGLEGDPYISKSGRPPEDVHDKRNRMPVEPRLKDGLVLEAIRHWYMPGARWGNVQMLQTVPNVTASRRQQKMLHMCSVMPELETVIIRGPHILEMAARRRWSLMDHYERERWVHGDWGAELLDMLSNLVRHRDVLRESFYFYSTCRDETHSLPWSELIGLRFGGTYSLLKALEMVDNEEAAKRGLSVEEKEIKVLFLEVVFIAEQNQDSTVLPTFPFTKEACDQLLERWTMAYALTLGEYLLFLLLIALAVPNVSVLRAEQSAGASPARRFQHFLAHVAEKVELSMGLTSYRFLDQLPVLHVIGRQKAELRRMILKNYGGMNDMSWSVFQKVCADLGVSPRLSYGQIRDLFLAFLMQGAENLPELQAYLTCTDGGNENSEPQVSLDDVPRLLACIGVLPNMEEPDDHFIAKGVDQFFSRVALAATHSTDFDLVKQQQTKLDASDDVNGRRKSRRRTTKTSRSESSDSKQNAPSTLEPKVNWLGNGGDASRATGLVAKGSLAGLALDSDVGVDLAHVKEADLRSIRARHGWI